MKKDLIVDIFAGGGGVSTGIFHAPGDYLQLTDLKQNAA